MTGRQTSTSIVAGLAAALLAAPALAAPLNIANAGFEDGTSNTLGAPSWTITSGNGTEGTGGDWFTTDGTAADSINDPSAAAEGTKYLSGNRLVTGATTSSNPQLITQLIDISADSALINSGNATVSLDFMFSDSDSNDAATVNIYFFSDIAGTIAVGSSLTTVTVTPSASNGTADAPWALRNLSGAVAVGAQSLLIELRNDRSAGSAGNVHFDDFSGSIVPEPASLALLGLGGLMMAGRRRRA